MTEIPITSILKTVTPRRLLNACLAVTSMLLSTLLRRRIIWGKPFILTVEPTNICNLKCPLCVTGNGSMARKAGLLDFQTFKKLIDENAANLFYLLLYQQGEPYLNKDFLKFVEYAKSKNIFVTTSTNAHFFTGEAAERTVNSGLDTIIVSIDGADQNSYQKYRVDGDLDKVKLGVKRLIEAKKQLKKKTPKVFIQFLVMRHNETQLKLMEDLTIELGADKLLVKTVQIDTMQEANEWLPKSNHNRRYTVNNDTLQPKRRGLGPCPRPWTSALMNWDGTIVPCCFDKNGEFTFGDTRKTPFNEIWKSKNYNDFRNDMLKDRSRLSICQNCSQGLKLYL